MVCAKQLLTDSLIILTVGSWNSLVSCADCLHSPDLGKLPNPWEWSEPGESVEWEKILWIRQSKAWAFGLYLASHCTSLSFSVRLSVSFCKISRLNLLISKIPSSSDTEWVSAMYWLLCFLCSASHCCRGGRIPVSVWGGGHKCHVMGQSFSVVLMAWLILFLNNGLDAKIWIHPLSPSSGHFLTSFSFSFWKGVSLQNFFVSQMEGFL